MTTPSPTHSGYPTIAQSPRALVGSGRSAADLRDLPRRPVILSKLLRASEERVEGPRRTSRAASLRTFSTGILLLLLLACLAPAYAAPPPHPSDRPGHVSGAATYALTKQLLAVAPKRFNGSSGHAAAEKFIESHFAHEAAEHRLEVDTFSASTPAGLQTMHNIIVKFPGKPLRPEQKDGIIVLGSHYETNYPLRDINFVGANDGACTSALLIEIGEYFRAHPPEGYSIWLVFFDGEEAVKSWGPSDSLYGSRHLAAKWSQDGTIAHIKAFLLADMIGAKDLNIDRDENSSPALLNLLQVAARDTGHEHSLFKVSEPMEDDTVPFAKRGVPVLDLIDLEYGPPTSEHPEGGYHHTAQDTLDKLSPQSLQTAADLFMQMIFLIDQR